MIESTPNVSDSQPPPAAASGPLSRDELILLAVGALLAFIVHSRFRFSGFGEQDAARLAGDAIHWHAEHLIYMARVDYRLRTSPLYIHLLKLALDHGLPIRLLPRVMNGASVLLSSVGSVGLYLLFRRFSSAPIAAAATVIYSFTPCYWLGSVYGMPTLPALTFWVLSVLSFAHATDDPDLRKPRFWRLIALSAALACLAFALKADMALSGGALLAILLLGDRLRPALLACAAGVLGLAVAFNLVYSGWLAAPVVQAVDPGSPSTLGGFLQNWNERFPFRLSFLLDPKNNSCITHASGTLLFALIVVSLLHGAVSGGKRARLTLGLAAWGLPAILFWGFKSGNSARHNLPAFPALVLLATGLLFQLAGFKTKRAWLLIALFTGVALLDTTGGNSVAPSVNLLATSHQVEGSCNSLHRRAREFMSSPSPKKAVVEGEYLIAFTEFEVWAAAKSPVLRPEPRAVMDGPNQETRIVEVAGQHAARSVAQSLRAQGFDVFSVQYSL